MNKLNCWEIKKCGREPGGKRVDELGICPAAREERLDGIHDGRHAGRACWPVAGTFCEGTVQGSFASKISNCLQCECYKQVVTEEGLNLQTTKEIIDCLHNKILTVGLPLLIKTGKNEDILTYLAGWKTNDYIIAQLPGISSKAVLGNGRYSLKYIKDGDAYVFDSDAISVQTFPVSVIYFKYPQAIRKVPLRKHKRYLTRIPAVLRGTGDGGANSDALIIDLSESGCRLKLALPQDREIKITDNFPVGLTFMDKTLNDLQCVTRNATHMDGFHFIGVEFEGLTPEKGRLLKSFTEFFEDFQLAPAPFL